MDKHLPVVDIVRDTATPAATFGALFVDGRAICLTLEEPWRDNQPNVSCIPVGTYKARMTYSPKFGRVLPELPGVPGRSAIRIHTGNTLADTEGCILLGMDRDVDAPRIIASRTAYGIFEAALNGAEAFWVNVRNAGEPEEAA